MNSQTDNLSNRLKEWLQENIPSFLIEASHSMGSENPWEMPVIDDFVLIVALSDFKDGYNTVLSLASTGSPSYRIKGLITEVLE